MNIKQLQHFEAVYRLLNFARAAAECRLTQSALSRSIKSLEAELGDRLFDRTTHAVEATALADALIHPALDVVASMTAFTDEITRLRGGAGGHVHIGAGPYPSQPLMTRVIRRLSASHPQIQVSIVSGTSDNLLAALVNRSLDFVVCDVSKFEEAPMAGEITVRRLPSEPLVVVHARSQELDKGEMTVERIASLPWALPTPAPLGTRGLSAPFASALASGTFPFYRLETTAACLDIVKDGRTLTIVPLSLAKEACASNALRFFVAPDQRTNDGIHCIRGRTRSAAVRIAIETVRVEAEAIAQEGVVLRG